MTLASIGAAAAYFIVAGTASAGVSGVCSNCHTMHNSQNGAPIVAAGPQAQLLNVSNCSGCHADSTNAVEMAASDGAPQVNDATNPLAGGYFSATADNVHNVFEFFTSGTVTPPGDSANNFDPSGSKTNTATSGFACVDCHTALAHHSDGTGYVADGYRFLGGIAGYEDSDWEYTTTIDTATTTADHNIYVGELRANNTTASAALNTMTAFCGGCHGDFHSAADAANLYSGGAWIRHPVDISLPGGEYASTVYSTEAPTAFTAAVATSFATTATTPNAATAGIVSCMSCHRAHGSANADLLRFTMSNAGGADTGGCKTCHTTK